MTDLNEFGQRVSGDLEGWTPPQCMPYVPMRGGYVGLEPMTVDDADAVYTALRDSPASDFTYMGFDPFDDLGSAAALTRAMVGESGWLPYTISVHGTVQGVASYLRDKPYVGVVEIGSIMFGVRLQRTTAATESIYLMLKHAFASGYRRVEWKCDALNTPSRTAADRLGFHYEGTFAKATHYKGRNRDTAWYAITDNGWPQVRSAMEAWLKPENFDSNARQIAALGDLMMGAGERT